MADPNVTRLLQNWRAGDDSALKELTPILYEELRRLARQNMQGERPDHTLQPTALVNEAYLRLMNANVDWQNRSHFVAVAARTMRRVLVDHAKSRQRIKRGKNDIKVPLEEVILVAPERGDDLIALDSALDRLNEFDARKSRIIELHFFGGLTYSETAALLDVSPATVDRDLRLAKAWLYRELTETSTPQ
ncbi:MAG: sigma-70 family RNA polymerase sigma factor [Gammaproteobacteria bacterium]|nr:sigma-70 family RNA polymerase sigma factor [Gammaproteobacteria bacterium]